MNVNPPIAPASTRMSRSEKRMALVLAVILLAILAFGTKTGRLMFVDGFSTPSFIGVYHDEQGGRVAFGDDGDGDYTARNGGTARVGWRRIDGGKMEFTRVGVGSAVCNYRFHSYSHLAITDCDFAVKLIRDHGVGFW